MRGLAVQSDIAVKRGETGFTLIEVIVALVILGFGMAFLTNTISDSLARTERLDADDQAVTLADTILASIGRDVPLQIGLTSGSEDKLYWRMITTQQLGPNFSTPIDRIDLFITNPTGHILGHWETLRLAVPTPTQ